MLVLGMPFIGIFTAVVFFLGGCGVRQRSISAAVLVFTLYLTNIVGGWVLGSFGNPLLPLVVLMLLFANVRATVLSRRWMAQPVDPIDQEFPERSVETMSDRFANSLPATMWSKCRYAFFPCWNSATALDHWCDHDEETSSCGSNSPKHHYKDRRSHTTLGPQDYRE
jgi:hypothetical protein